ncbi:MAG TPA: toll/interleukin-1 receptor domain-containing protein, partial [Trichocoleus sp.]
MPSFFDVFISYGRVDSKAFAARLNQHLSAAGLNVWLDLEDIPPGVDYQKEIDDSIDRAHNFIFILSPHAVNSEYCRLEIEQALRRKKRIIPLLHLEQIDQQTWKQRYPEGSEADWQAYQTAGKHSSYNNLLPAIRKLNWVPCREGVDDLDAALQGLLALCRRHTTYVAQHTQLLCQALTWKQQQKRNRYLLVGEERLQAEAWLGTRFRDEQPPCSPTDLHCEFITESTKNANNLMTQVFLAHAETDTATMEQIRRSLWREGITVWTSTTDIRTGEDLLQAVERGIEQADNVVYLLSPASQGSQYCQYELDYALALNKRVIPVLVSPTPDEQIPPSLRGLQYVDLTDNLQLEDYWLDESQLLRILAEDAVYHEHHKVLLTQALKWSRQNRNPAMLLRGYNLRHAENWIKAARSQAQPPVELHETFITESLRQPPGVPLDVFISYSRVDSDFARRLNEALQMEGKRTWFDQESIASGVDFQQEIYRGIETSDVFLFILSPQSIASPYCAAEVEYADRLNKRIVTALCRPINADDLHPVLAKVQWVNFRVHEGDFQTNLQQLLRALETDQQHLEMHTRLLVKAVEWDQRDRDESLLLRGRELEMAEHWLVNNAALDPRPADLHKQYVTTSRTHQTLAQQVAERRLRQGMLAGLAAAALGMIFALGSIWFAQNQQKRVEDILREAAQEVEAANAKVIEAKSQEGVALSREKAALERAGVADWTRQAAEKLAQTAQAAANQAAAAQRAAQAQTQTAVKQAEAADAQAKDALRRGQTADKNARDAAQRAETAARSAQAARVAAEAAHKAAQIAQKQRTLATEGTRLERNGTLALRLGETGKASGFLKVLEVGYRLERLVEDNPDAIAAENILTYPAASPILALQTL